MFRKLSTWQKSSESASNDNVETEDSATTGGNNAPDTNKNSISKQKSVSFRKASFIKAKEVQNATEKTSQKLKKKMSVHWQKAVSLLPSNGQLERTLSTESGTSRVSSSRSRIKSGASEHMSKGRPHHSLSPDLSLSMRVVRNTDYIPSHERLLEQICDDPTEALVEACKAGYVQMVKRLLANPMADPTSEDCSGFQWACARGHLEIVEMLFEDGRVDPSVHNNLAIRAASECGHASVVARLLQDARVNPQGAFMSACRRDIVEVIELLLKDRRVNPAAEDSCSIQWASGNGCKKVVKALLNDKRIDPGATGNYALRLAIENGHHEVVTLLLADKRVDPQQAFMEASKIGTQSVIERLLNHPGVDPSQSDNQALCYAIQRGYLDVLNLLKDDPRVVPKTQSVISALNVAPRTIQKLMISRVVGLVVFHPHWDIALPIRRDAFLANRESAVFAMWVLTSISVPSGTSPSPIPIDLLQVLYLFVRR